MTENNEYEATPNEAVVNEALAQAEAEKTAVFNELRDLDWGYRYIGGDNVDIEFARHTAKVIKSKQESLKKAREIVQEFLSTIDEDSELPAELIEMFTDLEDPLGLDLEVQEEATVEARFTVYYYRKPWEKSTELDSSDLSVSIEGNYGFELSDWSTDYIEVN